MSFVQTKTVLDDVLTVLTDSSPLLRAKMLTWLNNVYRRLGTVFPWSCLLKSSTALTITTNKITLPTDFTLADKIVIGSVTLFPADEVNEQSSGLWAGGGTTPIGYYIVGNEMFFVPGATGTATVRYHQEIPVYTDAATDTIFPASFYSIIERALLDMFYEVDADARAMLAIPFNSEMLEVLVRQEMRNPEIAKKYEAFVRPLVASKPAKE